MAPPHKKRRLFSWLAGDEIETYADTHGAGVSPNVKQVYNHALTEVGSGMEEHNIAHDRPGIPSKHHSRELAAREDEAADAGISHFLSQLGKGMEEHNLAHEEQIAPREEPVREHFLSNVGTGMEEHNVDHGFVPRQEPAVTVVTAVINAVVTVDSASTPGIATSVSAAATDVPSIALEALDSTPTPSISIVSSQQLSVDLTTLLPTSVLSAILTASVVVPATTSSSAASATLAAITHVSLVSSTTASKNTTGTDTSSLTTSLPGSVLGSFVPTGTVRSSGYYNSSLTYSSPTLTSSASTTDGNNIATSVYFTTATISDEGQPLSTITTAVGAAGIGGQPTDTAISTTNASSPPPPPPGTIAGGVVGGAAGLAVLLLVAMLFLRWYRRRSSHGQQALLPPVTDSYQDSPRPSRSGPGMAESAGIRPWAAAFPGILRHQPPPGATHALGAAASSERGFQRISGRKLPSAWSPGMEAPPEMPPYRGSGYNSIYPESNVTVANPFVNTEEGSVPSRQSSNERMTVVDGPQRRPTIHTPQRYLNVIGEPNFKHMSSVARTSGMGPGDFAHDTGAH